MDVCEAEQALQKQISLETVTPSLVPSEKNNGVNRRFRPRDVSSRYNKSPSPSVSRRCLSPNAPRRINSSSLLAPKRAQSAERKRPSTPPSPPRPSTPFYHDSSSSSDMSSRRITSSRLPDCLWPSTMRRRSVSFQSNTSSIPIFSKRERPVVIHAALSDHTLKPASNVAHNHAETRKSTPERMRSPFKGKNVPDQQSENSKPVIDGGLPARLVDLHRWPSTTGGRVSSIRNVDLADKTSRASATSIFGGIGISSLRKKPIALQKSASDAASQFSTNEREFEAYSVDDNSPWISSEFGKPVSSERMSLTTPAVRSQSLPLPGSRPSSPSKIKGVSPSRTRPSTPIPRGISPSRRQTSSISTQFNSSTSVLSFIGDFKKGKKGAKQVEDAHQLRLLYNRCLQWRYVNAHADAALDIHKVTAEKTLYNVWRTTSDLWDSISKKNVNLQQLRLEQNRISLDSRPGIQEMWDDDDNNNNNQSLIPTTWGQLHEEHEDEKTNTDVVDSQFLFNTISYLNDWAVLERDHDSSLSGAIEDLEASTLRLPVTGVAREDIDTLKVAICSAGDVMQSIGSSICSSLSRVESMNNLVSGLADIAVHERTMLDGCETLLASTSAMQVEEYSLRTHLIQFKQALKKAELPLWEINMLQ